MSALIQAQSVLKTFCRQYFLNTSSQSVVGLPVKTGVRARYYLSITLSAGAGTPTVTSEVA